MAVTLGSQGQADFTEPIELMMDCHRRIENFLAVLQRVVNRYVDQPLDDEARVALETALNYFHAAAPRHTADEEQSLFPRMRALNNPQAQQAMAQIDQLESDHRKAEQAHAQLDELGRTWLQLGRLSITKFDEFGRLLADLTRTYQAHIPIEDTAVFMLAKRVLDHEQLQAVGQEMKRRRIADPGRAGSRCAQGRTERLKTLTER